MSLLSVCVVCGVVWCGVSVRSVCVCVTCDVSKLGQEYHEAREMIPPVQTYISDYYGFTCVVSCRVVWCGVCVCVCVCIARMSRLACACRVVRRSDEQYVRVSSVCM